MYLFACCWHGGEGGWCLSVLTAVCDAFSTILPPASCCLQGAVDALTDWSITAQPPLTLRNDLPVAAHYVLWERPARGGSLVLRQQGRLEGWSSINVYSVDMRQQVGGGRAST